MQGLKKNISKFQTSLASTLPRKTPSLQRSASTLPRTGITFQYGSDMNASFDDNSNSDDDDYEEYDDVFEFLPDGPGIVFESDP